MSEQQDLKIQSLEDKQKFMSDQLTDLRKVVVDGFADLKQDLKDNYVTKDSFWPVKTVVYGLVAMFLLAIGGALIALIIK